ncbi:UPF0182 family protein [Desulfonema ishimotonii]|uniref:UPF0182 protein DENIS_1241 n=1 Tax=Desulfonema ishimotonii TaxID=45657 RepID=A0A401FTK8_9BACT|nr:UPF0182 family protein [Desulfonema ishimotonii]GBC60290.1 UPF0182 family protein [Desulfonema ishimotonii]
MQKQKRNWMRWLGLSAAALLGLGIIYIIFNFLFLNFFVDLWWFDSLGHEGYFLMRTLYRYLIFGAVILVFFLIFFFNFWMASRYLGSASTAECGPEDIDKMKRHQRLFRMFQGGSLRVYTPFSLLMAVPIAIPFYEKWEEGLLFFFSTNSGIKDPAFGKDISFYLFSLPIYTFIQNRLLLVFFILFMALLLLYFVENRMLCKNNSQLPRGAQIHLTAVAVIIIIIQTWGFALDRVELLYTGSHAPMFYGPGFIEMWLDLPLIWLTMITFVGSALSMVFYFHKRKGLKVLIGFVVIFLMVVAIRNTTALTEIIQEYIVKPNEAIREKPYIENSIRATLNAFALDEVETRNYPISHNPMEVRDPQVRESLRNVPVWDRELLDDVYIQLQSFRAYYTFNNVDVDRYNVQDVYQQVYLSARELNLEALPETARSWVNIHLQYTHGYGAVMTPAAQGGEEPMTWFIRDIPVQSDYGFALPRPEIYYGEGNYSYVIAPNDTGEIDQKNQLINYTGTGGVPLSSFLRKLLFFVYFKDRNIFFTTKTNSESRILFRQNFREAIGQVTPFFTLDTDPYIVSTSKGLFWIQDAYTMSDMYPNAQKYGRGIRAFSGREFKDRKFNYIRNSVKIVVDAYNGTIDYYLANPKDPIARTYKRIYPGLLKNMADMPEELKKHLRYPKQLFSVQMSIFAKYHQTEPESFYREEDTWEFAKMGSDAIRPYHMTLNLLDPKKQEFLLLCPMSPLGRDNLGALATVGCDPHSYGKIVTYVFPKGRQIYGPSQIEALINQDTDIAQELTLWDQAGSEVKFGRMIILPVKNSLLYIQPVYLRASSRLKIPELKRIMVSQGDLVVMDHSLEGAMDKLEQRIEARNRRIKSRLPGAKPPVPAETGEERQPAGSHTEGHQE